MPASAYAEALVLPARMRRFDETRSRIQKLLIQIEEIGRETGESAARLRARHRSLRLPDALVLACGELLDADAVLTTDRRWRRYDRVQVVV